MRRDSVLISQLFEVFLNADSFGEILSTFNEICERLNLFPKKGVFFYNRLKSKIKCWKALALWTKLDKKCSQKIYRHPLTCENINALVIGAGPCGLRTAIELALLNCNVVVAEKRDKFSRNNIIHLWPFVLHDLKSLGAKKFYAQFCAGSIDHISIRKMQTILLKVALLLGVNIHEGVEFLDLVEPTGLLPGDKGWSGAFEPLDHPLNQYEFDVIVGADGKKNTLKGFKRKEFRGKLAIAITANFLNRKTEPENNLPEISGTSAIFNPQFFSQLRNFPSNNRNNPDDSDYDMKITTNNSVSEGPIDLENLVYYKDDTHYFVMTAKKHSLIQTGVLKEDISDPSLLLHETNIHRPALLEYANRVADFCTRGTLPALARHFYEIDRRQNLNSRRPKRNHNYKTESNNCTDRNDSNNTNSTRFKDITPFSHYLFALNHHSQEDVSIFDFTSMFQAENSCNIKQVYGHTLLMGLVGDTLLEPFWPLGTGCPRGFLSAMDMAWMVKQFATQKYTPLQLIAERESIYKLLSQTSPENTCKNLALLSINPSTRYTNLDINLVKTTQVTHLYETDNTHENVDHMEQPLIISHKKLRKTADILNRSFYDMEFEHQNDAHPDYLSKHIIQNNYNIDIEKKNNILNDKNKNNNNNDNYNNKSNTLKNSINGLKSNDPANLTKNISIDHKISPSPLVLRNKLLKSLTLNLTPTTNNSHPKFKQLAFLTPQVEIQPKLAKKITGLTPDFQSSTHHNLKGIKSCKSGSTKAISPQKLKLLHQKFTQHCLNTTNNNGDYNKQNGHHLGSDYYTCHVCGLKINPFDIVRIMDNQISIHSECLKCQLCEKHLTVSNHKILRGRYENGVQTIPEANDCTFKILCSLHYLEAMADNNLASDLTFKGDVKDLISSKMPNGMLTAKTLSTRERLFNTNGLVLETKNKWEDILANNSGIPSSTGSISNFSCPVRVKDYIAIPDQNENSAVDSPLDILNYTGRLVEEGRNDEQMLENILVQEKCRESIAEISQCVSNEKRRSMRRSLLKRRALLNLTKTTCSAYRRLPLFTNSYNYHNVSNNASHNNSLIINSLRLQHRYKRNGKINGRSSKSSKVKRKIFINNKSSLYCQSLQHKEDNIIYESKLNETSNLKDLAKRLSPEFGEKYFDDLKNDLVKHNKNNDLFAYYNGISLENFKYSPMEDGTSRYKSIKSRMHNPHQGDGLSPAQSPVQNGEHSDKYRDVSDIDFEISQGSADLALRSSLKNFVLGTENKLDDNTEFQSIEIPAINQSQVRSPKTPIKIGTTSTKYYDKLNGNPDMLQKLPKNDDEKISIQPWNGIEPGVVAHKDALIHPYTQHITEQASSCDNNNHYKNIDISSNLENCYNNNNNNNNVLQSPNVVDHDYPFECPTHRLKQIFLELALYFDIQSNLNYASQDQKWHHVSIKNELKKGKEKDSTNLVAEIDLFQLGLCPINDFNAPLETIVSKKLINLLDQIAKDTLQNNLETQLQLSPSNNSTIPNITKKKKCTSPYLARTLAQQVQNEARAVELTARQDIKNLIQTEGYSTKTHELIRKLSTTVTNYTRIRQGLVDMDPDLKFPAKILRDECVRLETLAADIRRQIEALQMSYQNHVSGCCKNVVKREIRCLLATIEEDFKTPQQQMELDLLTNMILELNEERIT